MTVLIIFATIEGQTGKIAKFVNAKARELGHMTQLVDVSDPLAAVSFDGIDQVILAAPVHERRHPKSFEVVALANADKLNALPTLFMSISLNAAFPEGREEAGEYATEMEMRTTLSPASRLLVAGAVRTGEYDYYARQVLRHVVLRGHEEIDPAKEMYEFTDWDEVENAVNNFLS